MGICYFQDSEFGNRYLVGVPVQVFNDLVRGTKGNFDIDNPLFVTNIFVNMVLYMFAILTCKKSSLWFLRLSSVF